jgi:hypothetical protein
MYVKFLHYPLSMTPRSTDADAQVARYLFSRQAIRYAEDDFLLAPGDVTILLRWCRGSEHSSLKA